MSQISNVGHSFIIYSKPVQVYIIIHTVCLFSYWRFFISYKNFNIVFECTYCLQLQIIKTACQVKIQDIQKIILDYIHIYISWIYGIETWLSRRAITCTLPRLRRHQGHADNATTSKFGPWIGDLDTVVYLIDCILIWVPFLWLIG